RRPSLRRKANLPKRISSSSTLPGRPSRPWTRLGRNVFRLLLDRASSDVGRGNPGMFGCCHHPYALEGSRRSIAWDTSSDLGGSYQYSGTQRSPRTEHRPFEKRRRRKYASEARRIARPARQSQSTIWARFGQIVKLKSPPIPRHSKLELAWDNQIAHMQHLIVQM